jgi:hypothetical protein
LTWTQARERGRDEVAKRYLEEMLRKQEGAWRPPRSTPA